MITQDLLNYIKGELEKGTPKDVIQSNLVSGGWDAKDVAEGFSALLPKPAPAPMSAPVSVQNPVQPIVVQPIQPIQPVIQPVQFVAPVQPIQPAQPIQTPAQPIILHIPEMQIPVQSVAPVQNVQPSTSFQPATPKIITTQNIVQPIMAKTIPVMNYHIDVNQKKSGSPFGIIILILLILGGGAYAYYKYGAPNLLLNSLKNLIGQNATTTQNTNTADNASQVSSTSTSASSSVNDITGIYKNTKFGYQITLDSKWHIPVDMNKVSDLIHLSSFDTMEELSNEYNKWTPYIATGVIISDASLAEETAYYDKVSNSKDNQFYQFPGNIINIFATHSASSVKDVVATSTPSTLISKIIINNKYNGIITTRPGRTMISMFVDLEGSVKLADGTTANRLDFSSTQVSKDELLKIVNTLVY